jgi:hypothetical protein
VGADVTRRRSNLEDILNAAGGNERPVRPFCLIMKFRQLNDDQSPLTTLILCIECSETMRIEEINPEGDGKAIIQYRCEHCGRIERLRLIRRTWPSAPDKNKMKRTPSRARSQKAD